MIRRTSILSELKNALARSRVVVLAGPRQSGKTTLEVVFPFHSWPKVISIALNGEKISPKRF
jgi:predicted AAA+ superfamily ATPase